MTNHNRAYLEAMLERAKALLPKWMFDEIHAQALPRSGAKTRWSIAESAKLLEAIEKNFVPSVGEKGAKVAFIGASPSLSDLKERKPISENPLFIEKYIDPLGLDEGDYFLSNVVPITLYAEDGSARSPSEDEIEKWDTFITKELDRIKPEVVVALGKKAHIALGDRADVLMPHPNALTIFGDTGEVERKIKAIAERLRSDDDTLDEAKNGYVTKKFFAEIFHKEYNDDEREKHIVYGVVLEPEKEDLQNDIISAEQIEQTAHNYMEKYQVIGSQHEALAMAQIVESYIAPVAFNANGQSVPKGSWVMAVKIKDKELWEAVKLGDVTGFSIGAYGRREVG